MEFIRALPEDEITEIVNHLSDVTPFPLTASKGLFILLLQVLGRLDRTGQLFRMYLLALQKICNVWGVLPASYLIPGAISSIAEQPVAFGGFCDVFRGKVTGTYVCIKRIRICSNSNVDELRQAGYQSNSGLDSR